MNRHAADRTVKRLARRAGIARRISPHGLRHSSITCALDAGVALHDVQEAASHADPRTTMRYGRGRDHSTVTPPTSWRRSWPAPPADCDPCRAGPGAGNARSRAFHQRMGLPRSTLQSGDATALWLHLG